MATAPSKNWHWKTHSCIPWSKTYYTEQLTGTTVDGVTINTVTDVEGDAELGMRKSKLVTIYDQKITMAWSAKDSADEEVKGTLTALEVSHDMDEDEYIFTATLDTPSSKESEAFLKIAKKALANKLRPKFQLFSKAMIDTHGALLLVEDGADTPTASSGSTTPLASAKSSAPSLAGLSLSSSSAVTTSTTTGNDGKSFNTSVVKAEGEFQCSKEDLFEFLTDEKKIPVWSRNPATMKPELGAEMSLFGGNIAGKVTAVEKPDSITTTWRAPTWPAGYYGSLETTLNQGSNSTTLSLRLSGVPVGKEEESERNLSIYYIQALKQIGSVLPSFSFPSPASPPLPKPSAWSLILTTAIPMSISIGLIFTLFAAFYYGPSGPGGKA